MSESLHPTEGIRLLLELESEQGPEKAVYQASIYTVDNRFEYRAVLTNDGAADLTASAESALDQDEKQLRNLCASTARSAKRKVADGLPPWPPRILRWRGPGRGS